MSSRVTQRRHAAAFSSTVIGLIVPPRDGEVRSTSSSWGDGSRALP